VESTAILTRWLFDPGATLLLSILWANIPTASLASGPMCNLACCAGRAPHAAGSCMNGSCHAFLMGRAETSKIHVHLPVHESEQLCGLPRRTTRNSVVSLRGSTELTLAASSGRSRGTRAQDAANVSTSNTWQALPTRLRRRNIQFLESEPPARLRRHLLRRQTASALDRPT
jgi:hypothetical protein